MNTHDESRIQNLLRQALPPLEIDPEPNRDLWPAVLRHLDTQSTEQPRSKWLWFDCALAAGLAVVILSIPASIPMLLYYL
jgi:hypothetical protein